jgi:hypothetical protein
MPASHVSGHTEVEPAPVAEAPTVQGYDCDRCGAHFEGRPAGSGLFLWTRGEEVRCEEPPLCEECASTVAIGALLKWEIEEEEEG